MASPLPMILGATIFIFFNLFTPSYSALTCASQKLPPNRSYANCTNLPSLGATLHFTYNATNTSLAVAYSATPPKSDGWVGWGINPTGAGMLGAQAILAFKSNNSVTVQLYNLTAYKGIDLVKALSFETWDLAAEDSNGVVTIFATLRVPEKSENLSQVWQVGPVTGGKPMMHETKAENLQAKAALTVVGTTSVKSDGNNSSVSSGNSNSSGSGDKSGVGLVMGERFGFRFYVGLVLVLMSLVTM